MRYWHRSTSLFFMATLTLTMSCAAHDPEDDDRAAIGQVVNNSIGWALTKDLTLLYSSLAQDSAFFIFHPDSASTVVGWHEFELLTEVWLNPAFTATRFEVKDLRINLSRSGTVAWYSALLDDFAEWEGEPVGWENVRWTGVLEKRDGRWLITQMHFSFSVEQIRAEVQETQREG